MCVCIYFLTSILPFSKYSLATLLSHCSAVSCKNDRLIFTNSISATDGHPLASCRRAESSYDVWRDQGGHLADPSDISDYSVSFQGWQLQHHQVVTQSRFCPPKRKGKNHLQIPPRDIFGMCHQHLSLSPVPAMQVTTHL